MANKRLGTLGFVMGICAIFALIVFQPMPADAKKIVWKLQSSWPAADFHQNDIKGFAEKVNVAAGGRLQIDVLPAGAIVPAFEKVSTPPCGRSRLVPACASPRQGVLTGLRGAVLSCDLRHKGAAG